MGSCLIVRYDDENDLPFCCSDNSCNCLLSLISLVSAIVKVNRVLGD